MNRRNFISGALATGFAVAVPVKADSTNQAKKSTKVVCLREGYYTVDGWVVSEKELAQLKESGHVD